MQEEISEFYPPVLFSHSPVYHTWVKLFASDVYTLRTVKGFEDGPAFFWLNHPIRWVHLLGVVVAVERHEKRDFVSLDDASGRIAELVLKEDKHRQLVPEVPDAAGPLEIGTCIRVRGTFLRFRGRRQIQVVKLEVINDPNIEIIGWEERIRLKQEVLSKVWIIDSDVKRKAIQSFLQKHNKQSMITYGGISLGKSTTFKEMRVHEYTMQNLERFLLKRIVENGFREFTISILRVDAEIEYATNCIVMQERRKNELSYGDTTNTTDVMSISSNTGWSQSIEICRTIRKCLRKLVDDGLILSIDRDGDVYATVGEWNLRRLIRRCCRDALHKWRFLKQQNLAKEQLVITNKGIWIKIRNYSDEWSSVNKTLVIDIIEKVMPTLSGWYYAGKGKWILDK
ncbi:hypothetical protein PORY_001618 [Pneumocystis oryctolagi]|uniref:Uncharacterized protein n=1 Tax=Pneumocystis oryctolagi TaxID=42067 RepID=A0ACB7CDC2_9ASCO|nr:hypothetical protein PORY_001618 [Pneumocystis oryctolagi]